MDKPNLVILQPASNDEAKANFYRTIKTFRKINEFQKYLTPQEYELLNRKYENNDCQVWGVQKGQNNKVLNLWKAMRSGDVSLFFGKDGIYASGVITYTIQKPLLAKYLWGVQTLGSTWECLYFLKDVKKQYVPYSTFNQAMGYDLSYYLNGLILLRDNDRDTIIRKFPYLISKGE